MSRLRRTSLLFAALPLVALVPTTAAHAATPDPVAAGAAWLTTQFADDSHLPNPDGDHFDSKFGSDYFPLYGANADVLFALAGAQVGATKADTALAYLDANIDAYADLSGAFGGPYDGSVAKVALAHIVAGTDADDLLTQLKDDECAAAAKACTPGSPTGIFASASASFVILAESRAGGTFAPSADAVDYYLSLQCADGGFTTGTTACGSGDSDLDSTSYAIMALQALGGHAAEIADAADWLEGQRGADGSWMSQGIENTNSTGLATAALAGVGRDVASSREWLTDQAIGAGEPGAGALKYGDAFTPTTTSATSTNVLATAQGILGLVDDGSLATVSAAGSSDGVTFLAPTQVLSADSVSAGDSVQVGVAGFAAGEEVASIACPSGGDCDVESKSVNAAKAAKAADAAQAQRATIAPDGTARFAFTVNASAATGEYDIFVVGESSGLASSATVTVIGSATSTPPAGSGTATGSPVPPTSSTPPLAETGADTSTQFPIAVLALGAGLVLVVVARERRRRGRHAA